MALNNVYASTYWADVGKTPGAITPAQVGMEFLAAVKENIEKVDLLLSGIPNLSSAHLVEIGCGEGRLMEYIAPQVAWYAGIDVAQLLLERASQMSKLKQFKNTVFYNVGHLRTLTTLFQEGSLDAVVSFTVFMHMPPAQVKAYFQEARSILRMGGRFHFDCACTSSQWEDPSTCYDKVSDDNLFMARWFPHNMILGFLSESRFKLVEPPFLPHMVWKAEAI